MGQHRWKEALELTGDTVRGTFHRAAVYSADWRRLGLDPQSLVGTVMGENGNARAVAVGMR